MRATLSKDESLVRLVSGLIADRDPAASERFDAQFPTIPDNQHDELVALNRYLRGQLGQLPVNTISERECLIDLIEPGDWVHHFKQQVLPTILRFNLPRVS